MAALMSPTVTPASGPMLAQALFSVIVVTDRQPASETPAVSSDDLDLQALSDALDAWTWFTASEDESSSRVSDRESSSEAADRARR